MASNTRDVPVKMVRIQWSDKAAPVKYDSNIRIAMLPDSDPNVAYFRLIVDGKTILSEDLRNYQWFDEASMVGIAVIGTSSMKIIMFYDGSNRAINEFFDNMEDFLTQRPPAVGPETPRGRPNTVPPANIGTVINNLISSIQRGSVRDAENAAEQLARSRVGVQFHLTNSNNDPNEVYPSNNAAASASTNALQLTVNIECHLDRKPQSGIIYVTPGTKLKTLKTEIENRTGIDRKSQYWYAFERFIINDDYVFGSDQPVVPPRPKNAPRKQVDIPTGPIQSGDTLIMYVAQMKPYE